MIKVPKYHSEEGEGPEPENSRNPLAPRRTSAVLIGAKSTKNFGHYRQILAKIKWRLRWQ